MKSVEQIGRDLMAADDAALAGNSGGNLGMAFIAAAISDHADAVRELARVLTPITTVGFSGPIGEETGLE